jgi:hypothetical protein
MELPSWAGKTPVFAFATGEGWLETVPSRRWVAAEARCLKRIVLSRVRRGLPSVSLDSLAPELCCR